jgi:hypothetical protein
MYSTQWINPCTVRTVLEFTVALACVGSGHDAAQLKPTQQRRGESREPRGRPVYRWRQRRRREATVSGLRSRCVVGLMELDRHPHFIR